LFAARKKSTSRLENSMKKPQLGNVEELARPKRHRTLWGLAFLGCFFLFLIGLSMITASFSILGQPAADELIKATSNPFFGLFVGILVTAILQSSSTTTSMVVALVAGSTLGNADDVDTLGRAIPLIMGANIGTTVTSTIISLGHIASRKEYRKAVAAATMHDFFNIISVIVLFPLETMFGVLSGPAKYLADALPLSKGGQGAFGFIDIAIDPVSDALVGFLGLFLTNNAIPLITIPLALALVFVSLRFITRIFKNNFLAREKKVLERTLFNSPLKGLGAGVLITGLIQSSSVTTSLTVPLVATGKISMKRAFPFIMGANVGTTTTALLAAILIPGSNPNAALAIAFSHLLFNLYGVLLLFPIVKVRKLPVTLARKLGYATLSNRLVGILYILLVFFIIPFLMVVISGQDWFEKIG